MKKISILLIIISLVYLNNHSFAQSISSKYIDSLVESSMKLMPQAGIAIAVIQDGKVTHSKGYGITELGKNGKVDEHTLFSIASNSKAFTTTALGMLVDEGKLKWTDKVVDIIPEFKMYDSYVTENFTIVDLITHRSGLGLGAGDLMFIPDGNNFTIDDVLRSFQYQKPTSAFRTHYDYDNLLYITAGEVIARISGLSWDSFVEQRIMKPLGMNRSAGYYENLKSKTNVAMPHSSEHDKLVLLNTYKDPNKLFGAAGGIYASVDDLTKWMLMHLNDGHYGSEMSDVLISEKNHDELWKAQTNIFFDANPEGGYRTHYRAYGLGWNLTDKNGYTIVSHTGGMPGMLSQVVLIPELNAGIVVLTNSAPGGYSFFAIPNMLTDILIGADKRDWISDANEWIKEDESHADAVVDEVWKTVKTADSKKIKMDDFVGTYHDNWFGDISIEDRNGKLWFMSKRSPHLNGQMFYYKANTFAVKWEYVEMNCDAFATFTLDENGKAYQLLMKGISPNIDFSFDFQDLDLRRVETEKP